MSFPLYRDCAGNPSQLKVFEIDQGATQAWKRRRQAELGWDLPDWRSFVPVDSEAGEAWSDRLFAAGFDRDKPAIVVSTGVSMCLSQQANAQTLHQAAALAAGSTFAMSFLLPIELADAEARPGLEMAVKGAQASGTPFLSFFTAAQIVILAAEACFKQAQHIGADLTERYFQGRTDGSRPPAQAEELPAART